MSTSQLFRRIQQTSLHTQGMLFLVLLTFLAGFWLGQSSVSPNCNDNRLTNQAAQQLPSSRLAILQARTPLTEDSQECTTCEKLIMYEAFLKEVGKSVIDYTPESQITDAAKPCIMESMVEDIKQIQRRQELLDCN